VERCPDCDRPLSGGDTGTLATHCFANRQGDWLGERLCRDNTIARLRSELASVQALNAAEKNVLFSAEQLHKKLVSESIDDEDTGVELELVNSAVRVLLDLRKETPNVPL